MLEEDHGRLEKVWEIVFAAATCEDRGDLISWDDKSQKHC